MWIKLWDASYPQVWLQSKRQIITHVDKNMEKPESLSIIDENVKWCNQSVKYFVGFSKT